MKTEIVSICIVGAALLAGVEAAATDSDLWARQNCATQW
jgi:hypothetical protein